MLFSARIKELETQQATLTADRDRLASANAALTAQLAEHATELSGLQTAVAANESTIAALNADLDTARKSASEAQLALKAEQDAREAKIRTEVIARCAAAGITPIARDPQAATPEGAEPAEGLTGLARTRAHFASRQPKTTPATAPAPAAV
jgi:peptidoglycan hydrolase CwlO-like protein